MGRVYISGFERQYAFLSNFFIEPDGTHVEGEYQRAKCVNFQDRLRFHYPVLDDSGKRRDEMPIMPPKECKILGRKVEIRPDWDEVKVDIMTFYVTKKFRDHPNLAQLLRETEPCYLEELNYWGDQFWGVVLDYEKQGLPPKKRGLNMLGEILMQVRADL